MNPILECKGLTRKFNHFFALSNVDLTLERGEIIGLLYCIIELKSISGQRTDYRSFRTKRKRKDDSDQTDQRASFTN